MGELFGDENDICKNRHGGNEFSDEANKSIVSSKERQRRVILAELAKYPAGRTCEEVEDGLGLCRSSCSARFSELKHDKLITKVGKRPTKSGRTAGVWIVAKPEDQPSLP